MCKGMNRSLTNVILGGISSALKIESTEQKTANVVETDAAVGIVASAKSIIITPGYGLAVAKAQYAVAGLVEVLRKNGFVLFNCVFKLNT